MTARRGYRQYQQKAEPVLAAELIPPPPPAPSFFGLPVAPNPHEYRGRPRCVALREEFAEVVGIETIGPGLRVVLDQWYRQPVELPPRGPRRPADFGGSTFAPNPATFPAYNPAGMEWHRAADEPTRRPRPTPGSVLVGDAKPTVPLPSLSLGWLADPPELYRRHARPQPAGEAARPLAGFPVAPVPDAATWYVQPGEPTRPARPRQPGLWVGVLDPNMFVVPLVSQWLVPPPEATPRAGARPADFGGLSFVPEPADNREPLVVCPHRPVRPDAGEGRSKRPDESGGPRRRPDGGGELRKRPDEAAAPRRRPDAGGDRRARPDECGGDH